MTVVTQPRPVEGSAFLVLKNPELYENLIAGTVTFGDSLECELILREGRKELRQVDFPWVVERFIVADAIARDVVAPYLDEFGYWVPIRTARAEGEYWGFVCTTWLDALAPEAEVSRLPSGTIMNVRRLKLRESVVSGVGAFSLQTWPRGPVYFSSVVADAAVAAGLTGLTWVDVWSNVASRPAQEMKLFGW